MGRGNWLPRETDHDAGLYVLRYVDLYDDLTYADYEETDGESHRERWEEFKAFLVELLPDSFAPCEKRWIGNDELILAENGLLALTVSEEETYVAVCLRVRPDVAPNADYPDMAAREPLARRHLERLAARFFDTVHETYPLRVRYCAWTSGPYVPTGERKAAA